MYLNLCSIGVYFVIPGLTRNPGPETSSGRQNLDSRFRGNDIGCLDEHISLAQLAQRLY